MTGVEKLGAKPQNNLYDKGTRRKDQVKDKDIEVKARTKWAGRELGQ